MSVPDLADRFLQPEGWTFSTFESHGMRIRFGMVSPPSSAPPPEAVVVCLPGLSEFCEKYYEVARDCLKHNLAFCVLDWPGQGKSQRYLSNPHKRHAQDFSIDVERLHDWITKHIIPAFPDIPLVMLSHSMGGNIGLRFLHEYPDIFQCAALSAPLFGISAIKETPCADTLVWLFHKIMPRAYVFGGGDWNSDQRVERKKPSAPRFSHDSERALIHHLWSEKDIDLRLGSPTFTWLFYANRSCHVVNDPSFLSGINTPILVAIAGQDTIVDNDKIRHRVGLLRQARCITLEQSAHEILMEADQSRDVFLQAFIEMIKNMS